MARDPARKPRSAVIMASNAAAVTGIVLLVIGLFTKTFLVVVGVFLLAVAVGLTLVNLRQRNARLRSPKPPPAG